MNAWRLALITAPAAEPLSRADLQMHCRLSGAEVDAQSDSIIRKLKAAREACERVTGRQLITATWELRLDEFPDGESDFVVDGEDIVLPLPPLQSVTSIKYLDEDNVEQTLSSSYYVAEPAGPTERSRIVLAEGCTWPSTYEAPGAVRIRFIAGYGTAGSSVPAELLESILDYAAASYVTCEMSVPRMRAARSVWASWVAA